MYLIQRHSVLTTSARHVVIGMKGLGPIIRLPIALVIDMALAMCALPEACPAPSP